MPSDKQRRAAERRRLQRQLQRRRERAERRRRLLVVGSVIGVLVVIGLVIGLLAATSGDDNDAAGGTPTCAWKKGGTAARKVSVPSTTSPSRTGTTNVSVTTNRGNLTFALSRAKAPCAVESFVSLAQQKYFDKTPCHRLTASATLSVLQCGDPGGTGGGGPGYSFADELSGNEKYTRGVLAMANSGADTNGSQFFIVYKNSKLPASYTVFGTVSKGLGVVDKVAAAGIAGGGSDGKPKESVTLTKVTAAS